MLRLGRYEIEAEIAQGSMGVVYLANDPRVRRRLALKTYILPRGLSREEEREFSERFLREAQAAGALSHPAIVTVYDAGEDAVEGVPFIAMEYVPGRSLRQVLMDEGRLPPERAFEIASTLADALHMAHEAGIIHRDVKPANILVREPDGAVKIADFGVARLPTSELTRSGLSFGSPAYMAPEQFRGALVDRRSDLFSLAVILYQALSGERPFGGSDLMSIAYSVVNEAPVPIVERVENLPPGLDRFFEKALAKDPDARFQTGAEFRLALEEVTRRERPRGPNLVAARKEPASPALAGAVRASAGKRAEGVEGEGRLRARAFGAALLLLALVLVARHILTGRQNSSQATGVGPAQGALVPSDQGGASRRAGVTPTGAGSAGEAARRAAAGPTGNGVHVPKIIVREIPTSTVGEAGEVLAGVGATAGVRQADPQSSKRESPPSEARGARKSSRQVAAKNLRNAVHDSGVTGGGATISSQSVEPGHEPAALQSVQETPVQTASELDATSGSDAAAPVEGVDGKQTALLLSVRSDVEVGTLKLIVDGREVYSRRLWARPKEAKGFWKKVFTRSAESFKARITVPPGRHEVVVVVLPGGNAEGFEQRTVVDLKPGEARKLRLVAGKESGPPLVLYAD